MASANTPLEFNADERNTAIQLARAMKGVAAVLLILGGTTLVVGLLTPVSINLHDVLLVFGAAMIEGAVTCLLGLVMLASAADVRFMVETRFATIHLGNALRNLSVFYKCQFLLAAFLVAASALRLFVG